MMVCEMNRQFSKKKHKWVICIFFKHSTSPAIRELQNKIALSFISTQEWQEKKNQTRCRQIMVGMEEEETFMLLLIGQ